MILEGFTIENWSCIKHLTVSDLPQTGVVVLHGPNGTGKSSILEALRACLMDNKSTSKALGRGLPKNSSEKPRVTVTFRAAGTTWRITKVFGSKESKLESQTSTGQWKLETCDASEAHERTRSLAGGSDSALGLHQLLWLTQAEFRLPEPKKFDADVQSKLREVLGVLQTPLDDRFLARVKQERSRWFDGRSKAGEKPKVKKDCALEKANAELALLKKELEKIEGDFEAFEKMRETAEDLEIRAHDLRRQSEGKTQTCLLLQREYERSLTRIEANKRAAERVQRAGQTLTEMQARHKRRLEQEDRLKIEEKALHTADADVEERARRLEAAERNLFALRAGAGLIADKGRALQGCRNEVHDRRQGLGRIQELRKAREVLQRAEQTYSALEELKEQARACPAPDDAVLKELAANRAQARQARAGLEAAAIVLTLRPEPGAAAAHLAIDGAGTKESESAPNGAALRYMVRRKAELTVPGWGKAVLNRGTDARSLDQLESDLRNLERAFAERLALFGIAGTEETALDQLRERTAEKRMRAPELARRQQEFARLAPHGLDPLREQVIRLQAVLEASGLDPEALDVDAEVAELDKRSERLKQEAAANLKDLDDAEKRIAEQESEIEGGLGRFSSPKNGSLPGNSPPSNGKVVAAGLRQEEAAAKEKQARLRATVEVFRGELERMLTPAQLDDEIRSAQNLLEAAHAELAQTRLSESEETIQERLAAAQDGMKAVKDQLSEVDREYHRIEGSLRMGEGLHPRRSASAARVEELTARVERERLESIAWDRLHTLFEECRAKQLGTLMGPIHDRVLSWMRLLRIGGYEAIHFNDQFLPERLVAQGGAVELNLCEESTGTVEQIALMVRLALGATLSTEQEPVVAMLDDPLTHSDVVRLDRMRAVLKNAAAGDPNSKPPAGPLQVLVFTCHPEWFMVEGAKMIDLAKASRAPMGAGCL